MSDGTIAIRSGDIADLGAVVRIEQESFGDPWSRAALLTELQPSPLHLALVAEWADEVVGYLMAWLVADELHVLNIAVAGRARRRGAGAALLAAAMDVARRSGQRVVTLEVRVTNLGAQRFYARLGFQQEGVRRGYYPDTGEDALILTRSLADS